MSSLPSTLVKCLYLFFDLPGPESPDAEDSPPKPSTCEPIIPGNDKKNSPLPSIAAEGSVVSTTVSDQVHYNSEKAPLETAAEDQSAEISLEMTTMDRRLSLQKIFVQVRMCDVLLMVIS